MGAIWSLLWLGACSGGSEGSSPDGAPGSPRAEVKAKIEGTESFDWVGYSAAPAGDVNGDGKADLMVSALSAGPGGRVALFFGPLVGTVVTAEADVLITGELTFSNAGQSGVEAGACDFDGDGLADLLMGAPFADRDQIETSAAASGDNAGRAYIVFGSRTLPRDLRLDRADVTMFGEKRYDTAGFTVACLGDLDRDGFADMGVAAPRHAAPGAKGAGALYVVYGRERAAFPRRLMLEAADAVLTGESAYDAAGTSIARADDLTGDGLPDFLVGAPGADAGGADGGMVYVVAGARARLTGVRSLAEAAAAFHGRAGQRLGMNATAAGDFDGDGRGDVLIGGGPVGAARTAAGEAYLVRGGALAGRKAAATGLSLVGERAGDGAGIGVGSAGDLNGDGRADLLIGAPTGDGDQPGGGRAYFVAGRALSGDGPQTIALGTTAVVLRGKARNTYAGEIVQRAGDLDGDGVDDVLVTARGEATTRDGAGAVYVLSGRALGGR
jgi:hypothetical protein